ncbi:hypothetical protein SAMN04488574_101503 [Bacillus sp. 71mf]|nr:hypothetical protein SAMN04488574_101503 [Bacillus sp. 71mf]SFS78029.1 hypothetical protein SAMN04488145_103274 [Bacillus sp. 103mf]
MCGAASAGEVRGLGQFENYILVGKRQKGGGNEWNIKKLH